MTVPNVELAETIQSVEWGNVVATELNAIAGAGGVGTNNLAAQSVTLAKLRPSIFTRASNQSIPSGSSHAISWTGETQDADGWGTVTTDTLTCPTNGAYMIVAEVEWASVPTAGSLAFLPTVPPGVAFVSDNNTMNTTTPRYLVIHFIGWMRTGQVLVLAAGHSTGSAINVTAQISLWRLA